MSDKLYDVIAEVMNVPISQIKNESSAETLETWDSFRGLVLMDQLETTFNVKFTLDEVLHSKTVYEIKRNLRNHGILLD